MKVLRCRGRFRSGCVTDLQEPGPIRLRSLLRRAPRGRDRWRHSVLPGVLQSGVCGGVQPVHAEPESPRRHDVHTPAGETSAGLRSSLRRTLTGASVCLCCRRRPRPPTSATSAPSGPIEGTGRQPAAPGVSPTPRTLCARAHT